MNAPDSTPTGRRPKFLCLLPEGLYAVSAFVAGVALWSWVAGVEDLLVPDFAHVPTAPSTAILILLAGFAGWLLFRWPHRPVAVRTAALLAAVAGGAGLLAAVRPLFGWGSPLEEWLAGQAKNIHDVPLGQMAPSTGMLLVAVALAVMLRGFKDREQPVIRRVFQGVCGLVAFVPLAVLALYALNHHWIHGSAGIPMAAWTAAGFLALGLALLASAWSPSPPPIGPQGRIPVLAGACLVVGITAIGAIYLRDEQAEIREEMRIELEAIGNLKAEQIAQWRRERSGDARVLSQADFVARVVRNYLDRPDTAQHQAELQDLMMLLCTSYGYERVVLYDANQTPRMAWPAETRLGMNPILKDYLSAALRTNQFIITDLHRADETDDIHMDLLCPMNEGNAGPAFAVLLVRLNPRHFLFPLIQKWPTPSQTAETLLVRREGEEVVFLNELRHQTNTALRLRHALTNVPHLPAAKAVLGHTGMLESVDYRGVPVLAALRPVPESPWFMVAKVDLAEIYAPLREQAWMILLLTVVLSAAAGLGARAFWQKREAQAAHRQLADERERRQLAERVGHLMQGANDAILILDDQLRILEANQRAAGMYGRAAGELAGVCIQDLRTTAAQSTLDSHRQELLNKGQVFFETEHRHQDGRAFPVEVSARLMEVGGQSHVLSIIRDISQRKQYEREIERLTRLYATLSQINQGIVRVNSRQELFDEVCRVILVFGKFKMAWVGWVDPETKAVHPVSQAGDATGYIESRRIYADDRPTGRGPVGISLRTGRTYVCNDVFTDPAMAPWLDAALAAGFAAHISLPIRLRKEVVGALVVYAEEAGCFGPKEVNLLEEAALDVSFALDRLADLADRIEADEKLRESEARYRQLFESMNELFVLHELVRDAAGLATDYRLIECNSAFCRVTGIAAEKAVGALASELYRTGSAPFLERYAQVVQTGQPEYFEAYFAPLNKYFAISVFCPTPGRFATVSADITDRKAAEAQLQASEDRLQAILDGLLTHIALVDEEGRVQVVNAAWRNFAEQNGLAAGRVGPGVNYLQVCEAATGDDVAIGRAFAAGIREVLAGRRERFEMEYPCHSPAEQRWFTGRVTLLPAEGSRQVVVAHENISERKLAEATRLRLLHILESSVNEIYVFDAETLHFEYVNRTALRNLGYSPEQMHSLTPVDLKPEFTMESFQAAVGPLRRREQIQLKFKTVHRRADGSQYPVEVHLQLVELEGRQSFLAIIMDISERRQMEQQIQQMEALMRQQQKLESIGTLAAGVAHEINNPINGIMNYAQIILDEAGADAERAEYAREIIHETERVAGIVRNLLQFARHEKQSHSPAQVQDIIEQTLILVRTVIKRDQITLRIEVPDDLPSIKCRSQQIQQVLMNLLTNARDALNARYAGYHEDKQILVRAANVNKADPTDAGKTRAYVRITVEDRGTGVPAEIQSRIFDPFYTTKPRNVGTGLGLSISHSIVQDHHGELWLESIPGQGAKFIVDLPVENGWTL